MIPRTDIAIIGAGHAGGRLAESLRKRDYAGSITLIGEEAHPPYERPPLSKEILLGTKGADELMLRTADQWMSMGITHRAASKVDSIDTKAKLLRLSDGSVLAYGKAVVATGGAPRRLDVPGASDGRVVYLRTLDDALALVAHLEPGKRVVVIGGGVIGLEVAASARRRAVAVVIIETADRLMGRIGPPILSDWLLEQHRAAGVDVFLATTLQAIEPGPANLMLRVLNRSSETACVRADVVLVAIGIAPSVDMLPPEAQAGPHGIPVDQWCRIAALPDLYAIGDVAQTFNTLYQRPLRQETWRNAERQPAALADILCGGTEPYLEVPWMWTDQYDRNIQVVGVWEPGEQIVTRGVFGQRGTGCFFLRGNTVTGAVLIDLGRERRWAENLVFQRSRVEVNRLADAAIALRSI